MGAVLRKKKERKKKRNWSFVAELFLFCFKQSYVGKLWKKLSVRQSFISRILGLHMLLIHSRQMPHRFCLADSNNTIQEAQVLLPPLTFSPKMPQCSCVPTRFMPSATSIIWVRVNNNQDLIELCLEGFSIHETCVKCLAKRKSPINVSF